MTDESGGDVEHGGIPSEPGSGKAIVSSRPGFASRALTLIPRKKTRTSAPFAEKTDPRDHRPDEAGGIRIR